MGTWGHVDLACGPVGSVMLGGWRVKDLGEGAHASRATAALTAVLEINVRSSTPHCVLYLAVRKVSRVKKTRLFTANALSQWILQHFANSGPVGHCSRLA